MIEKVKMFGWLFGHTVTHGIGGLNGIRNESFPLTRGESGVMARLFFWLLSGMLMCPKCFRPPAQGRLVRAVMVIRLMTGLLLVYQALIVSLFNRSELDCLVLVALARNQLVVRGREGVALSLPSFILPVIRTQACPGGGGGGDCSETYNYFCCRHYFCSLWWCLNLPAPLELESTKYFELNPPLVIAFFVPWSIIQRLVITVRSVMMRRSCNSVILLLWMSLLVITTQTATSLLHYKTLACPPAGAGGIPWQCQIPSRDLSVSTRSDNHQDFPGDPSH